MTPIMPSARRKRNQEMLRRLDALSLTPGAIAAFDAGNDAREAMARAIAKARVSSAMALLADDDDD